jgi:integrase
MARPTGQVIERERKTGRFYGLRFRAYGKRQYVSLGGAEDGWTRRKAEVELENLLADVRRGIWRPHEPEPEVAEPKEEPTFHEFASEWFEAKRPQLRPKTERLYKWQITHHLLPYFAKHRLSQITVEGVDRYRNTKVRERERGLNNLSNGSINKTIGRLAQILEDAVEYGHLERNPARGRRRLLKAAKPVSSWLESDQVAPLLEAAGGMDAEARSNDTRSRRVLLATLILTGMRVGEATALRWRDVDLASGKVRVGEAKTDAGMRAIDMSPDLRDELAAYKARTRFAEPSDLVFPTHQGRIQNTNNILGRTLRGAVEKANERLAKDELPLIPEKLKTHELRHTFCSLLFEAGASVPYVMEQIGHADPGVTLKIYAHVLEHKRDHGARMDSLVRGADWAPAGTRNDCENGRMPEIQRPRQDLNLRPAA